MDIINIKQKILNSPKDDKIYLLEYLSDFSGFFIYNNIPLFLVWNNTPSQRSNSINTNLLEMEVSVKIESIENSNSYKTGYYNLIKYMGSIDSNEFFSFIELCSMYSKNQEEISFIDFFHAMLELFQFPHEQNYKDALGLYGELKFLEYIKNNYSIDFTKEWHQSGTYSKFDISAENFNIEIKTTLSENVVKIKHEQIFNEHNNYLASVVCENYDSGETLTDLINRNQQLFSGLSFILKLKKELSRIKQSDIDNLKFYLQEIHLYKADKINPFVGISDDISELNYYYDLSSQNELSNEEIKTLINSN